mmetsp:Transcript_36358/g.74311  ORF Transcript_36358/g.74311 Transcript_36358/m.74311 type:complete len:202 (-) Transcript_36358:7-612(-)
MRPRPWSSPPLQHPSPQRRRPSPRRRPRCRRRGRRQGRSKHASLRHPGTKRARRETKVGASMEQRRVRLSARLRRYLLLPRRRTPPKRRIWHRHFPAICKTPRKLPALSYFRPWLGSPKWRTRCQRLSPRIPPSRQRSTRGRRSLPGPLRKCHLQPCRAGPLGRPIRSRPLRRLNRSMATELVPAPGATVGRPCNNSHEVL